MTKLRITDQLFLSAEKCGSQYRLIVFNGNEEMVCHKTNSKELKNFADAQNAHLFKGRLQLHKQGNDIIVIVKGTGTGLVPLNDFTDLL